MIEFGCKNCGRKLNVEDKHSGKRVKCPKCGSVGVVPDNSDKIKFQCDSCGQSIIVPKIHAGKKGKCPKCKNPVVIPSPDKGPLGSAESDPSVPSGTDEDQYEDESDVPQEGAGVNRRLIFVISGVAAVVVVGLIILVTVILPSGSRQVEELAVSPRQEVGDTGLRPQPVTSETQPPEPIVQESPREKALPKESISSDQELLRENKIAFVSFRDGNAEIYIMNADGTGQRRLTNNRVWDENPSLSPDGKKIAFASRRDGNHEIYVMNTDGTEQRRLTNSRAKDEKPSWSPDGKKIAFGSMLCIHTMNADGSEVKKLRYAGNDLAISWSPDGKKIAFGSQGDIYTMNPDGSEVKRLTDDSARGENPCWSPDGKKIAFGSYTKGLNSEICVMNADGSGQRNLTNNPAFDSHPCWSQDGNKIVFMSERDRIKEIYAMNPDGSEQRNLTNNPHWDVSPSCSPFMSSGTQLAEEPESEAVLEEATQERLVKQQEEQSTRQPKPGDVVANSIGMKLVYIPVGSFMMGSSDSATQLVADYNKSGILKKVHFAHEFPQHQVRISKGFWMGQTEVTQSQYKSVMNAQPWSGEPMVQESANNPAVSVDWKNAAAFCRKLSQQEGKTYRLPTEAEWEYACRAGTTTRYSFGDSDSSLGDYAWFFNNADKVGQRHARPVGQKKSNPWGLYDMHGNVQEWCSDLYAEDYYSNSPSVDPKGPSYGTSRFVSLRGGAWHSHEKFLRCSARYGYSPHARFSWFGFRVVCSQLIPPPGSHVEPDRVPPRKEVGDTGLRPQPVTSEKKQTLAARRAEPEQSPSFVGKTAPSFTLRDLNGKQVSLSDFKGKVVLLDFWGTWCGPCRRVIPHLEALHKKYKDQGLVIIGMNHERDHDKVRAFAKEQISYIVLLDADEQFKEYGIRGIPAAFYIDRDGKIRYREVGYSPGAEIEVERKVNGLLNINRLVDKFKRNNSRFRAEAATASVGSFVEGPAGTYTMTGSGADIWGKADEFHYAFKTLTGFGSIVAKVESVVNTNNWAKAGVMIRETLDPGSVHATMVVTPGQGISFQRRTGTDNVSSYTQTAGIGAPYWVKIERDVAGNFKAYSSTNGSTWEMQGTWESIQMSPNVYIGLAVTSRQAALTCQAVFTNVTITGTVGPQWANQDIGITIKEGVTAYAGELDRLIDQLKRISSRARARAASALGKLGDKRAVEPLIAALKDEDRSVRKSAASALGNLGDERAIEPLIAALSDVNRTFRDSVSLSLRRLADKGSAERLAAHLEDKDIRVRESVAETLARMGDKRAFESLIVALKDKDEEVRRMAASVLGRLGDPRAIEPLIAALEDENNRSGRWSVADALGKLGNQRAVEPLIAALKDEDRSVRSWSARALATLGDKRAVEPLIAALNDNDSRVRESVITALAKLGDRRAVEPLIAALKDNDPSVQRSAASVLAKLGDRRAVEPFIAALKDNDARVRRSAASALGRPGDKRVFEPLIAALKDSDASVRQSAASALGRLGDEHAVDALIMVLKDDEDVRVRSRANGALGRLRWQPATNIEQGYRLVASQKWAELVKLGPSAVEPLITVLKDTDHNVRRSAAGALEKIDWQPATDQQRAYYLVALQKWAETVKLGSSAVEPLLVALKAIGGGREGNVIRQSAREALVKIGPLAVEPAITALKDDDTRLHRSAVRALGILRDKRAVESLIAALKYNDAIVRRSAASELRVLGDKRAVEPLIAVLKDTNAGVRRSAASTLGELGDKRAVEPLIAALKDQDKYVLGSAAFALGLLGDERAVEPLIAVMSGADRNVRWSVGSALSRLADKGSAERLVALLEDTDMSVRALAAETLARLGDKRAFEPLIAALKDKDVKVRLSAASALAKLGDKRAVEPLIAALSDEHLGVRGSVAGALGQLGDERAVEPLREVLRYDDDKVLSSAALALAQLLGDERAVEPLLAAISHPDSEWAGMGLLVMLERIGPPAVEPLIAALKHEDKPVRYIAAHVLVQLDDKRAVEPVITFLKSVSDDLREPGAKALEAAGSSTVEYLVELLKHKEMFYVRSSSAWALGWLGDKRAVEPLVAALGKAGVVGNAYVARVQAAIALGRLGDKRAIEPLIDILKRNAIKSIELKDEDRAGLTELRSLQAQSWQRSVTKTMDALVKIGPLAVEPLIGVLKDENAYMRSFAAESLGKLGDKRAVQPLVTVLKDEDEQVRQSAKETLLKLGWRPDKDVE